MNGICLNSMNTWNYSNLSNVQSQVTFLWQNSNPYVLLFYDHVPSYQTSFYNFSILRKKTAVNNIKYSHSEIIPA